MWCKKVTNLQKKKKEKKRRHLTKHHSMFVKIKISSIIQKN